MDVLSGDREREADRERENDERRSSRENCPSNDSLESYQWWVGMAVVARESSASSERQREVVV
jgi:hypothetical protein